MSIVIYIFLGAMGLPVFSGYAGGITKLLSPTGGFIFGYIFMNLFISIFYDKKNGLLYHYIILLLANIIIYILGASYFAFIMNNKLMDAFKITVLPFIITDNIKIVITLLLNRRLKLKILDL